jgi:hypothetical protein
MAKQPARLCNLLQPQVLLHSRRQQGFGAEVLAHVHLLSVTEGDGKAAGTPLQPPAAAGASTGQERQSKSACVVLKHSVVSRNTRLCHLLQPQVLLQGSSNTMLVFGGFSFTCACYTRYRQGGRHASATTCSRRCFCTAGATR